MGRCNPWAGGLLATSDGASASSSWADEVRQKQCFHDGLGLAYIPPSKPIEGVDLVVIEPVDVVEGVEKWKHAIIGFTLGKPPPFTVMKLFCK